MPRTADAPRTRPGAPPQADSASNATTGVDALKQALASPATALSKPQVGSACNGCGLGCHVGYCGVAAVTLGKAYTDRGSKPCLALVSQPDGRKVCGLVLRPKDYSTGKGGAHDLRAAVSILLGARSGCDFLGDDEDPRDLDSFIDRIMTPERLDKTIEAAERWFGPEGAAEWLGPLAALPLALDQTDEEWLGHRTRDPRPRDRVHVFNDASGEGYAVLPVELAERIVTIAPIDEVAPSPVEPEKESGQNHAPQPAAPRLRMLMSRPETMSQGPIWGQ